MRKLFLFLVMMLLPMMANADAVEIDGIWYILVQKAKQAQVTNNPNGTYSGNVIIPELVTYDGIEYDVTSINSSAFRGCSSLSAITIPNSVSSIDDSSFENCSGLFSVTIPPSVTYIGMNAFRKCTSLTSVIISDIAAWCNISFGTESNLYANPLYYAHHLFMNGEEIKDLIIPPTALL